MKIGIDLLWVRPSICGGTEAVIRNLMTGFGLYGDEDEFVLFVTKDNAESFQQYGQYPHMRLEVCDVLYANQVKRIFWENLHLDGLAKKLGLDLMFIPVYSMPLTHGSKIPYVCVIHDLQALHYPQYFSAPRKLFFKFMWRHSCARASRIITISDYCRRDLVAHYPAVEKKCSVVYNPIETAKSTLSAEKIEEKYGVQRDGYFYCVSSMLPHKNLETLLEVMACRKSKGETMPLVISGVGGDSASFDSTVERLGIGELVINTGFVSDEERDCLYENCRLFLFPSVFEGFGMPPVEAMRRGKRVVMTKESCLEEVTEGKGVYVESPKDVAEWTVKIDEAMRLPSEKVAFERYETERVVREYQKVFREVIR